VDLVLRRLFELNPRRPGYAQDATDPSNRSAFDPVVSRHGRLSEARRVHPHIVFRTVMVQNTTLLA
jgi:hypothetical protein